MCLSILPWVGDGLNDADDPALGLLQLGSVG